MITKEAMPPARTESDALVKAARKFVQSAMAEFLSVPDDVPLEQRFQDLTQKAWIEEALRIYKTHSRMSRALGINRTTLRNRCRRLEVSK